MVATIGASGGGSVQTLKVDPSALDRLGGELGYLAWYLGSVAESAPHDFNMVVQEITPSDLVCALMTYADSWIPPLVELTNTLSAMCSALSDAATRYAEADAAARAHLRPGQRAIAPL